MHTRIASLVRFHTGRKCISSRIALRLRIIGYAVPAKMQFVSEANVVPIGVAVGAVVASVGLGATYYLATSKDPAHYIMEERLANQSIDLGDGVRGSVFKLEMYDGISTLCDVFERGIRESGNGPCLGTRSGPNLEYEWISYQEVWDRAHALGSWMSKIGLGTGTDAMVAIYGANRAEWVITEWSCYAFNRIPVALYDTLGAGTTTFILQQAEVRLAACDTSDKVKAMLKEVKETPNLKHILVFGDLGDLDVKSIESEHGIYVTTFSEAIEIGKASLVDRVLPKETDLATIMYTSGTTGVPKGVMLTHANIVCNAAAIFSVITEHGVQYNKDDVIISYLPLAHIFERLSMLGILLHGGRNGFSRGDISLLFEDIQALKPTLFPTVPRLMNKIYDKVLAGVQESKIKSALFRWAMSAKQKQLKRHNVRRDTLWDKLVFSKIQALFGGRVRMLITGSAPLADKVISFFRCALGCVVVEGYGQTESTAGITLTLPGETIGAHVGGPLPSNQIKLFDVPENGYYAENSQGEICARGPNVFKGYYKNEEKTSETIDDDGWLHTGDIGEWLPNGTLKIIDRKKNIFKLAQGEYVAPEKVELVFIRSKLVAQAFVDGDSLQPYLMCVVVPDAEVLVPWATKQGLKGTFVELCENKFVKDAILVDINKIGRENGLKGFELAKDVHISSELFSVENTLLTPTFKNKRHALRKHFADVIKHLYNRHGFSRQKSMV